MANQFELFNILSVLLFAGGAICAISAFYVFMRLGIREYFVLVHYSEKKSKRLPAGKGNSPRNDSAELLSKLKTGALPKEGMGKTAPTEKRENSKPIKAPEGGEATEKLEELNAESKDLTGVLNNDADETAMLSCGGEETSALEISSLKNAPKNTIRDNALWAAPLSNIDKTLIHDIVKTETKKDLEAIL